MGRHTLVLSQPGHCVYCADDDGGVMEQSFTTSQIMMKINEFTQTYRIQPRQLLGADFRIHAALIPFLDEVEVRVTTYLAEHQLMNRKVTFPSTWWDALKDRFCPQWLRKRVSINFTSVEVNVSEIATRFKVPKDLGPVPLMIWNQREWVS